MMASHANTVAIVNGMIGSVNKTGPASDRERRRISGGSASTGWPKPRRRTYAAVACRE
jgi:hypothetical protein